MFDSNYDGVKTDFIMVLRIIYREGLSDVLIHSMRSNDSMNDVHAGKNVESPESETWPLNLIIPKIKMKDLRQPRKIRHQQLL